MHSKDWDEDSIIFNKVHRTSYFYPAENHRNPSQPLATSFNHLTYNKQSHSSPTEINLYPHSQYNQATAHHHEALHTPPKVYGAFSNSSNLKKCEPRRLSTEQRYEQSNDANTMLLTHANQSSSSYYKDPSHYSKSSQPGVAEQLRCYSSDIGPYGREAALPSILPERGHSVSFERGRSISSECGRARSSEHDPSQKHKLMKPPAYDNRYTRINLQKELLIRVKGGFLEGLNANKHMILTAWEKEITPRKIQSHDDDVENRMDSCGNQLFEDHSKESWTSGETACYVKEQNASSCSQLLDKDDFKVSSQRGHFKEQEKISKHSDTQDPVSGSSENQRNSFCSPVSDDNFETSLERGFSEDQRRKEHLDVYNSVLGYKDNFEISRLTDILKDQIRKDHLDGRNSILGNSGNQGSSSMSTMFNKIKISRIPSDWQLTQDEETPGPLTVLNQNKALDRQKNVHCRVGYDTLNTDDPKMKSRCRRYLKTQSCPKESECKFLHAMPKDNNIFCSHFLEGTCARSADDCWYKHPEQGTSQDEINKSPSASLTVDSKMNKRCRRYLRSRSCPKGKDCKFIHALPKHENVLCKDFEEGKCSRSASDCWYFHKGEKSAEIEEPISDSDDGPVFSQSIGNLLARLKNVSERVGSQQVQGVQTPKTPEKIMNSACNSVNDTAVLKTSRPRCVAAPAKKTPFNSQSTVNFTPLSLKSTKHSSVKSKSFEQSYKPKNTEMGLEKCAEKSLVRTNKVTVGLNKTTVPTTAEAQVILSVSVQKKGESFVKSQEKKSVSKMTESNSKQSENALESSSVNSVQKKVGPPAKSVQQLKNHGKQCKVPISKQLKSSKPSSVSTNIPKTVGSSAKVLSTPLTNDISVSDGSDTIYSENVLSHKTKDNSKKKLKYAITQDSIKKPTLLADSEQAGAVDTTHSENVLSHKSKNNFKKVKETLKSAVTQDAIKKPALPADSEQASVLALPQKVDLVKPFNQNKQNIHKDTYCNSEQLKRSEVSLVSNTRKSEHKQKNASKIRGPKPKGMENKPINARKDLSKGCSIKGSSSGSVKTKTTEIKSDSSLETSVERNIERIKVKNNELKSSNSVDIKAKENVEKDVHTSKRKAKNTLEVGADKNVTSKLKKSDSIVNGKETSKNRKGFNKINDKKEKGFSDKKKKGENDKVPFEKDKESNTKRKCENYKVHIEKDEENHIKKKVENNKAHVKKDTKKNNERRDHEMSKQTAKNYMYKLVSSDDSDCDIQRSKVAPKLRLRRIVSEDEDDEKNSEPERSDTESGPAGKRKFKQTQKERTASFQEGKSNSVKNSQHSLADSDDHENGLRLFQPTSKDSIVGISSTVDKTNEHKKKESEDKNFKSQKEVRKPIKEKSVKNHLANKEKSTIATSNDKPCYNSSFKSSKRKVAVETSVTTDKCDVTYSSEKCDDGKTSGNNTIREDEFHKKRKFEHKDSRIQKKNNRNDSFSSDTDEFKHKKRKHFRTEKGANVNIATKDPAKVNSIDETQNLDRNYQRQKGSPSTLRENNDVDFDKDAQKEIHRKRKSDGSSTEEQDDNKKRKQSDTEKEFDFDVVNRELEMFENFLSELTSSQSEINGMEEVVKSEEIDEDTYINLPLKSETPLEDLLIVTLRLVAPDGFVNYDYMKSENFEKLYREFANFFQVTVTEPCSIKLLKNVNRSKYIVLEANLRICISYLCNGTDDARRVHGSLLENWELYPNVRDYKRQARFSQQLREENSSNRQ